MSEKKRLDHHQAIPIVRISADIETVPLHCPENGEDVDFSPDAIGQAYRDLGRDVRITPKYRRIIPSNISLPIRKHI